MIGTRFDLSAVTGHRRGAAFGKKSRTRTVAAAAALLLWACGSATTPAAVPVTLDGSFGSEGLTLTDIGGPVHEDEPFTLIRTADGGFAAPGKAFNSETGDFDIALLVYRPDGMLDPSFAGDGIALVDFGHYDEGQGVVQQTDGKFVVGGFAKGPTGDADFALVRFHRDGTVDESFGTGGKVTTDFFGWSDTMLALAIQPDGKLVAGGHAARSGDPSELDFALARYNPDGSLDPSFGVEGKVTTDFFGGPDFIFRMLIQDDGKIVGVGSTVDPESEIGNFAVARYNSDGSLDPTFGSDPRPGLVTTDFYGQTDYAFSVLDLPDGKLLVAGLAGNPATSSPDAALVRYNPDGSVDHTFAVEGEPGMVTVDFFGDYDQILALAIQPDGKIMGAGHAKHPVRNFEFGFVRFAPDGKLDTSFGTDGKYTFDGFGGPDGLHGLVLQDDGKAVAAGDIENPATGGDDFALIRLLVADIDWTVAVVEQLPDEAWSEEAARSDLIRALRAVDAEMAQGDVDSAVQMLKDLRPRMNGCGNAGPDSDDWLTTCAAQYQVRVLIEQIIHKLGGS